MYEIEIKRLDSDFNGCCIIKTNVILHVQKILMLIGIVIESILYLRLYKKILYINQFSLHIMFEKN